MRKTLTLPDADVYTPYGATEALPVCSISGREIVECTAAQTRTGAGTCVGSPFPTIAVKVVAMTDGPIASLDAVRELPDGEIGEIIVRGPSVTREYFRRPVETRQAKIPDGESFWHRMGDVGYFDSDGQLWFCGRKSHVVETREGKMFPVCCEAIFHEHPHVYRSALVGIGDKPEQEPVLVVEPEPGHFPRSDVDRKRMTDELFELGAANEKTERIARVLFHRSLPVDARHNVKIARLALAAWAEKQIPRQERRSNSIGANHETNMPEIVRQK
jgi:acyl-CoA synthetase (AMP-forming)/AMP-acid ligase II